MWKVRITVESDNEKQAACQRQFGYIIECEKNGKLHMVKEYGRTNDTYHRAILQGILEALARFKQNCSIEIFSKNEFVANQINELAELKKADFKTKTGKEMANADLWRQLAEHANQHVLKGAGGPSAQTAEIKRGF